MLYPISVPFSSFIIENQQYPLLFSYPVTTQPNLPWWAVCAPLPCLASTLSLRTAERTSSPSSCPSSQPPSKSMLGRHWLWLSHKISIIWDILWVCVTLFRVCMSAFKNVVSSNCTFLQTVWDWLFSFNPAATTDFGQVKVMDAALFIFGGAIPTIILRKWKAPPPTPKALEDFYDSIWNNK